MSASDDSVLADEAVSTAPSATEDPQPTAAGVVDLLSMPEFEEVQAEWARFWDELSEEKHDVAAVPMGHHVAYYAGAIRGHDRDQNALRSRVAAELGIHPERIVVSYLGQY